MKPPPIVIPNFAKKYPKRQAHIRIPCQCENPPPRDTSFLSTRWDQLRYKTRSGIIAITLSLSFGEAHKLTQFTIWCIAYWLLVPKWSGGGGRKRFGDINFRQISHRFTSSFTNPSFQDLNGSHIMYRNMMILNPSRFKVEPHSKYWYFCIERVDLLSLRFSENAVLFHI